MKLKKFAAFAVSTVMASALIAVPASNVSFAEYTNIISNSTFDTGTKDWGIYKESGGSAALSTDNGRLARHDGITDHAYCPCAQRQSTCRDPQLYIRTTSINRNNQRKCLTTLSGMPIL